MERVYSLVHLHNFVQKQAVLQLCHVNILINLYVYSMHMGELLNPVQPKRLKPDIIDFDCII